MKKLLIVLVLALCMCSVLVACDDANDLDYTIEIQGITSESIYITKSQIMELAESKSVEYTQENPCYASDKTDDDGNLIPHTLKGVYLDDILDVYADGAVSGSYSSLSLRAMDGYETILTSDTYNLEQGGSRMIIAYEYDGVVLKPNESSGSLRTVFVDQVANSWVKKLKTIIFSDAELIPPAPSKISFMELLGNEYNSSFDKTAEVGEETVEYTYYGISIEALLDSDILNAEETDKMYLIAWDFITNGTDYFYREYTNWKSYEYYEHAFLVDSASLNGGAIENEDLAPIFEGANIQKGMTVKNMLSITVSDTALVCLDIAFERFGNDNDEIDFIDILSLVNMYDEESDYKITTTDDNSVVISAEELSDSVLTKSEEIYTLNYGEEQTIIIKDIEIIE